MTPDLLYPPNPEATTAPCRKQEELRVIVKQANKVRVTGRLQGRRIQESHQEEADPLCLSCPTLISFSPPLSTRGKGLLVM